MPNESPNLIPALRQLVEQGYVRHKRECNAGACRECGWSEPIHPLRPSTSAGTRCEVFQPEPCTCGLSAKLAAMGRSTLDLEDRVSALWSALCEGDGEHSEALDKAIITAHFRSLLAGRSTPEEPPVQGIEFLPKTLRRCAEALECFDDGPADPVVVMHEAALAIEWLMGLKASTPAPQPTPPITGYFRDDGTWGEELSGIPNGFREHVQRVAEGKEAIETLLPNWNYIRRYRVQQASTPEAQTGAQEKE